MLQILSSYFVALFLTIVIETTVALVFGYKKKTELIIIALINAITNPLLNYTLSLNYYFVVVAHDTFLILLLEVFVVLVEWRLLRYVLRQGSKKLFWLSLLMNLCSFFMGVIFFK